MLPVRRLLLLSFVALAGSAHAIPQRIALSGQLTRSDGAPLEYFDQEGKPLSQIRLDAEMYLYDSETTGTLLHTAKSTANVALPSGHFGITLVVPREVLVLDDLWYTLAIDVDQDGIDERDLFADRFQIVSVPFALTAQPVVYFDTHGGYISTTTGTRGNFMGRAPAANYMVVAPFTTPPGGVRFNRVNLFVQWVSAGSTFSVGVYDSQGNKVVSTEALSTGIGLIEAHVEIDNIPGDLLPSSLYFTAMTATSNDLMMRNILVPSVPLSGIVPITPNGALLPESFQVGEIIVEPDAVPVSLTLTWQDPPEGVRRGAGQTVRFITKDGVFYPD